MSSAAESHDPLSPNEVSFWEIKPLLPLLKNDAVQFLSEVQTQFGDLVHVNILGTRLLIVSDFEWAKGILTSKNASLSRPPVLKKRSERYGIRGILVDDGESWQKSRTHLVGCFHKKQVENKAELLQQRIQSMVASLGDNHQAHNTLRFFSSMMLSLVFEYLYDYPISNFDDDIVDVFYELHEYFFDDLTSMVTVPLWMPSSRNRKIRDINQRFHSNVNRAADTIATNTGRPLEELRNEISNMFVAGMEATASMLTWATYVLAEDTTLQQTLRQAITPTSPETDEQLESFLNEVMRMYPSGYMFNREVCSDFQYQGFNIRKGTQIIVSPYRIHRNASLFKDPETFKQDRFVDFRCKAHMPFGLGARFCVGSKFAMLAGKSIIAELLKNYQIEKAYEGDVKLLSMISLTPGDQVICRFNPIEN